MLAVLGIAGVTIVALAIVFGLVGCASSTPPSTDGDVREDESDSDKDTYVPPDGDVVDVPDADASEDGDIENDGEVEDGDVDGGDIEDGDVDDIEDGDVDGIEDGDVDDIEDGDIDNDGDETDADVDENPPIPGYNPTAYQLGGVFRDLDVIAPGKIRAFGGTPLRLLECDIDGIDNVTCHDVVDMPTNAGDAVNYEYRGEGIKSIAVAAAAEETPIDIMLIDEDSDIIEPHYQIEEVPMPGFSYTPTRPRGVASCYTSVLDYERIFISTANWLEFDEGYRFVQSTVLLFGDRSTAARPVEGVGFSSGVNATALAAVELDEAGEPRPWVIGINAGSLDPFDERHAAIDFMDPEPVEFHTIRSTDLGAIELFALSEVKFNPDESAVYMVQKAPTQEFMRVDLSSSEKQSIPIEAGLIDEVVDMDAADGQIYIAGSGGYEDGSVLVVDETVNGDEVQLSIDRSYDLLNASPVSMVVTGGIVAVAGDDGISSPDRYIRGGVEYALMKNKKGAHVEHPFCKLFESGITLPNPSTTCPA